MTDITEEMPTIEYFDDETDNLPGFITYPPVFEYYYIEPETFTDSAFSFEFR